MLHHKYGPSLALLFTIIFPSITGDLEPTFSRCCNLGMNWGQEGLQCAAFPAPVTGIPAEQQAVCLSTVQICCMRKHRERQCEAGKLSAKADKECRVTRETGGESHRDCCEGCKLGLVAGTMAMGCSFRSFRFGMPWDEAFVSCCQQILPQSSFNTSPLPRPGGSGPRLPPPTPPSPVVMPFSQNLPNPNPIPPDSSGQDLCSLFPNELCAQICVPTSNSYRCECRNGFSLLADGKSCQQTAQVDRCNLNNPCSQKCIDTGLAIECACNPGYQLGSDLRTCHDVDECSLGADNCDPETQVCVNEPGNFRCIANEGGARGRSPSGAASSGNTWGNQESGRCPAGFRYNIQSRVCDDIDECVNPRACPALNSCQNTIGSFTCERVPVEECRTGYRFDIALRTCVDIDECERADTCPRTKPLCINTPGSFVCQWREPIIPSAANSCPAGYKFNTLLQSCEDVDECGENLHACNPYQEMCVNEQGKYRCDRIEPVNAESGENEPNCPSGYVYDEDDLVCLDLDECLEAALQEKTLCKQEERCVNTEGAYQCVAGCPKGFQPDVQASERCVDIDECAARGSTSHTCTLAERCVNTVGSYRCESLRPTLHTSTVGSFSTVTTPTPRQARTTTANRVTNNVTIRGEVECPLGYQKDASGRCKDLNECMEGSHVCKRGEEDCVNTPGSYRCKPLSPCLTGYKRDTTTGKCVDVDECTEQKHNCPATALCVNQYGNFVCRPFPPCPPGHRYNVEARYCQDIDECAESVHNCSMGSQACINAVGAFRCVDREPTCSYGYRYNLIQQQCIDVDECAESTTRCSADQDCVNSPGSFQCVTRTTTTAAPTTTPTPPQTKERCADGYRFNRRNKTCLDIDECAEDRDVCNKATESCVNEPGGYRCVPIPPKTTSTTTTTTTTTPPPTTRAQTPAPPPTRAQTPPPAHPVAPHGSNCPAGHRYHILSKRCVDVNECVEGSPCRGNQQCENTVGSYVCRCAIGFRFHDRTQQCEDINECSSESHNCLPSQRCDNTVGSFSCVRMTSCGTGYTFNSGTGECEDDDECSLGSDNCQRLGHSFICRNTQGSFRCDRRVCEAGFKLNTGGKCTPIVCPDGFSLDVRDQCLDMDECTRGNPCSSNQRCVNTVGSYTCQDVPNADCPRGYEFSEAQRRCVDVDECAKGTNDCRRGQTCQNKPGGYDCVCAQGYQLKDRDCVDIDECERYGGSQLCASHVCVNTPGSYRCDCKDGFRTQGQTCVDIDECSETPRLCQHNCVNTWGSYQCTCDSGYTINSDNRSCQDIDECEQYRERGLCNGLCVNKPGSYVCSCPEGYRLSGDSRTCQDIDECTAGNRCQRDEICLNTRGGYHCNSIVCPPNYVKDQEHRNYLEREDSVLCKKQCTPRDYRCLVNNTLTITYQFISLPSVKRLDKPMVLTRMQAVTVGGGWSYKVTFDIIQGNDLGYFGILQDANFGSLQLVRPLTGPKVLSVKIQMNVMTAAFNTATKHLAIVDIYVSANEF